MQVCVMLIIISREYDGKRGLGTEGGKAVDERLTKVFWKNQNSAIILLSLAIIRLRSPEASNLPSAHCVDIIEKLSFANYQDSQYSIPDSPKYSFKAEGNVTIVTRGDRIVHFFMRERNEASPRRN